MYTLTPFLYSLGDTPIFCLKNLEKYLVRMYKRMVGIFKEIPLKTLYNYYKTK